MQYTRQGWRPWKGPFSSPLGVRGQDDRLAVRIERDEISVLLNEGYMICRPPCKSIFFTQSKLKQCNGVSGQTCLTCNWGGQASWAVCSRPLYFLGVGHLSRFSPTNRWVGRVECRGNILARWADGLLQQWGTEVEQSSVIIMGFAFFFNEGY